MPRPLRTSILPGLLAVSLAAQQPEPTPIANDGPTPWDGSPHSGRVGPDESRDFELALPDDACFLKLDALGQGRVNLMVFEDAADLANGSWYSIDTGKEPGLEVQNYGESLFDGDSVFVRVTSGSGDAEDFELEGLVVRAAASLKLGLGKRVFGAIRTQRGFRQTFRLEVPPDIGTVRLDLVGSERDLDLFVSSDAPCVDLEDARWTTESYASTELLRLDLGKAGENEGPRAIYATVVDPNLECEMEPFELYATAGTDTPAALARAPEMPLPDDPTERTIAAIVELRTPDNWGSGVFVGQGMILTAKHLFEDENEDEVTVAVTVDPMRFPIEMLRGRVVAQHETFDLALVKIEGNAHGAPLPADFENPVVELGFGVRPRLGQPVSTIGYPEIGGVSSRRTITWSRGALAGFDPDPSGDGLKTDAVVAQGNSGGALLDDKLRLIGITTSAIEEVNGSDELGYATPVRLIPPAWRELWLR